MGTSRAMLLQEMTFHSPSSAVAFWTILALERSLDGVARATRVEVRLHYKS